MDAKKEYKPVPDVDCLKYHGTPDKPDIKIFVSHRIDQDSETIDNPLYIPVRCGAIYDEREGVTMLGDDTGDNISEKRESYCELTVQYWAWKNIDADYYGLCHYRRYLSFSDKHYKNIDGYNHVIEKCFNDELVKKYGLTESNIIKKISGYDIVSLEPVKFTELAHMKGKTVYESIEDNNITFPTEAVDAFIELFKSEYPKYADDVDSYFSGDVWRGFNCYILRKDLFFEYNEIVFNLLSKLEKKIDMTYYSQEQLRVIGYMGEVAFGVFFQHISNTRNIKTRELQLIKIENTTKKKHIIPAYKSRNVPVVVASSNEYVPFLSVLLQSIKVNSNNANNYDIIIFETKISEHNKKIIKAMFTGKNNFSIRFVNAERYLNNRKLHTAMHVTTMTYLRLAILDVLESYDKAVYLDCDVVVNRDIAELFDINLEGFYIAAAVDTVMAGWCNVKDNKDRKYVEEKLRLKRKFEYFNAGIISINLAEFRKKYTSRALLDIAELKPWRWFDQDVLNMVCEGKAKLISNKWNVMAHQHEFDYQLSEFFAPNNIFKNYKEALEDPWAIHYAGRFIPCFALQVDLAEYFWRYARETPYYELIISCMTSTQIGAALFRPADNRTPVRKFADKLLPMGSRRRAFAKWLLPKGSLRWRFLKQIYYIFRPQYRPAKIKDEVIDDIEDEAEDIIYTELESESLTQASEEKETAEIK